MVDAAHFKAVSEPMTVIQSRTSWGVEVGRHRLSVSRTHEARTIGRTGDLSRRPISRTLVFRPAWPLAVGTFASVSAFGLFVFGAVASEPLLPQEKARYLVSLPVPIRATKPVKAVHIRKAQTLSRSTDARKWVDEVPSGPRFDAADEPHVVQAMHTGEFQEWLAPDGQRHFLSVGSEQAGGRSRCRDMALLVRGSDGSSRTRTARRCLTESARRATHMAGNDDRLWTSPSTQEKPASLSAETDASSATRTIDSASEPVASSLAGQ